jgi:hypothetical protein
MNHYELLATIASILTSRTTPIIVLSMSWARFREESVAHKTARKEIQQIFLSPVRSDQGAHS